MLVTVVSNTTTNKIIPKELAISIQVNPSSTTSKKVGLVATKPPVLW